MRRGNVAAGQRERTKANGMERRMLWALRGLGRERDRRRPGRRVELTCGRDYRFIPIHSVQSASDPLSLRPMPFLIRHLPSTIFYLNLSHKSSTHVYSSKITRLDVRIPPSEGRQGIRLVFSIRSTAIHMYETIISG